jgi:hypothetical protein
MSVPVLPRCHAVVMLATSNGFAAKLDGRMRGLFPDRPGWWRRSHEGTLARVSRSSPIVFKPQTSQLFNTTAECETIRNRKSCRSCLCRLAPTYD